MRSMCTYAPLNSEKVYWSFLVVMAGYGGQGYNQDFYESGYDMDGMQQQVPPPTQQASWQEQVPPAAPVQTHSQWSGAGQQPAYYPPTSYSGPYGYGQQGKKLNEWRISRE